MQLLQITKKKICNKCSKQINHAQKEFCDSCFVKVFEKRIRKHLRQLPFEKLKNIIVTDKVSEYLIKRIITAPIKITYKPLSKGKHKNTDKNNLIMISLTTDDAVEELLEHYFSGKKVKTDNKVFPLLEPVTNEELNRFCQLKKLPYLKKQRDIGRLLSKLEAKYPSTKHALYSTLQELRKHKFYK